MSDRLEHRTPLPPGLYHADLLRVELSETYRGSQLWWVFEVANPVGVTEFAIEKLLTATTTRLTRAETSRYRRFFRGLMGRNPTDGESFVPQHWTREYYEKHPDGDPHTLTGRQHPWRVVVDVAMEKKAGAGSSRSTVTDLLSEAIWSGDVELHPEETRRDPAQRPHVEDLEPRTQIDPRLVRFSRRWSESSPGAQRRFELLRGQLPHPPMHAAEQRLLQLLMLWNAQLRTSGRISLRKLALQDEQETVPPFLRWLEGADVITWQEGQLDLACSAAELGEICALISLWREAGRPSLPSASADSRPNSTRRAEAATAKESDVSAASEVGPGADGNESESRSRLHSVRGTVVATLLAPILTVGVVLAVVAVVGNFLAGWLPATWFSISALDWIFGRGVEGDAARFVQALVGFALIAGPYAAIRWAYLGTWR